MRVLPVLLALLAAGCAAPSGAPDAGAGDAPPENTFDFSSVVVLDHDHGDAALHEAGHGLEPVGFVRPERPGVLPGGYLEVALAGSFAFVSNYGPERGFSVIDVGDPAAPRHVADFFPNHAGPLPMGAGTYWDVSVTEEGDLVVLSAQAAAGPVLGASAGGVYLVDVRRKDAPRLESFTPVLDPDALIPVGVHNANPFRAADGALHVAATTGNGATHLLKVEGAPGARTLREVGVVAGMHDSTVQVHPLTNRTLLYTAHGGVFIWDVSDPAHPEEVSFTPDSETLRTYHQTVPSDVLIDGRHYTVAATESAEGMPTPFTLLDTTDPAAPVVRGQWTLPLPATPTPSPYRFSGHNLDFDRGRLYVGHYHAGVWVVDVSNATLVDAPKPIAFFLPHETPSPLAKSLTGRDAPSVWGAVKHTDGLVYAADALSGLHVLRPPPEPAHLADAPAWPTNLR